MKMARKTPNRPSPADLMPPGLRDALTPETRALKQSKPPAAESAQGGIDPEVRHRMIIKAAYQRYAQRGYVEGFELEDWLQAEAEVDRQLANRERELEESENSSGSAAE
jgi:hypothetical protein